MARRGLLQSVAYQAQRRRLSQARRAAFTEPPTRRNRMWQADFSQFETGAEGPGSSAASSTTSPRWCWPVR